jgi:hypothetical protein
MSIIKKYHDKKWTLQFLDALYNSIDILGVKQKQILLAVHFPHILVFKNHNL